MSSDPVLEELFQENRALRERLQQMEKAMQDQETQLRRAQKLEALGVLAGGITHDFNNILGAILGYSELSLLCLPQDHQVYSYLKQVFKAASRAKELVQQIQAVGRQQEQARRPMELHLLIKEVLHLLREIVPSSIQIRQQVDPHCGPVMADPVQIHQVVMNLCTTAVRSMANQEGLLEIKLDKLEIGEAAARLKPELKPGVYVRLQVTSNGQNMDAATLERILNPYSHTVASGQDTELGLAVAQGIVISHGGAISASSLMGERTTFQVYLPCHVEFPAPEHLTAKAVVGGQGRILLVDDEPQLAEVGKAMLNRLGYQVTAVTSSLEALATFRAAPEAYDLVITDQTMPQMTGYKLAKELLSIRSDLPIILITGYSDIVDQEKAEQAGFRDFLFKPLSMPDLAAATRRAIQTEANMKSANAD